MDAYDRLIGLTDDVARGKASPDAIAAHIDKHDLGQEIAETAQDHPDIKVTDATPQATEAARAGHFSGQTPDAQQNAAIDDLLGSP